MSDEKKLLLFIFPGPKPLDLLHVHYQGVFISLPSLLHESVHYPPSKLLLLSLTPFTVDVHSIFISFYFIMTLPFSSPPSIHQPPFGYHYFIFSNFLEEVNKSLSLSLWLFLNLKASDCPEKETESNTEIKLNYLQSKQEETGSKGSISAKTTQFIQIIFSLNLIFINSLHAQF